MTSNPTSGERRSQELVEPLDEFWKKEAIECIFGSELLFGFMHDLNTEDCPPFECEIVVRRKAQLTKEKE